MAVFPSYFKFTKTPIPKSNNSTQVTESANLKTIATKRPGQRWEFTFQGFTEPYNCITGENDTLKFLGEFVASADGGFGIFDYTPKPIFLINPPGVLSFDLGYSAGESSGIVIRVSHIIGQAPTSLSGKMFKIGGIDKAYMIKSSSLFTSGTTESTYFININPPLQVDVDAGRLILSDSTNFHIKLRLSGSIVSGSTNNIDYQPTYYNFKMIEAT